MNTFFKFVDEVVLKPYLVSKGLLPYEPNVKIAAALRLSDMTEQSIRNQRTRAKNKWDALMLSIDLEDVRHNSRRWIIAQNGEFSIVEESDRTDRNQVLPYDSFTLGFVDYAGIVEKMQAVLPKTVGIKIERNVTSDGHAKLTFEPSTDGQGYVSTLASAALDKMRSNSGIRREFYLDPVALDQYSNQFAGQITDNLAFWMGDVVDALDASRKIGTGFRDALITAMRERRGSKTQEYIVPTHDTSARFQDFLDSLSRKFNGLDLTEQVIKQMPVAEHGKLASRRWGIEIETGGARGVDTPAGWDRKYDGSLSSAYTGSRDEYVDPMDCDYHDHNQWRSEYLSNGESYIFNGDVLVAEETGYYEVDNPDYSDPDYCEDCGYVESYDEGESGDCAEFVSPILKSFHSKGLEELLEQLHEQPQNDSAGIHVHVESKDLTPKQVGSLVVAYQVIEKLITSSYNRHKRVYCKVRDSHDVIQVMRGVKTAKAIPKPGEYDADFITGDRYHSVNLCALAAHGTIEFRSMGPVAEQAQLDDGSNKIDYDHLVKWASFCREMVNVAKAGAPIKAWTSVRDFNDVIAIFAKYGQEVAKIRATELDQQLASVPVLQEV